MTTAYLGLGANLGDALSTLKKAIAILKKQSLITINKTSSFYKTEPINAIGDDYFNAVIKIETHLSSVDLLKYCLTIERDFGRERSYKNAPRTLDIDILLYGEEMINKANLIIPHPRLTERAFALIPLIEIEPTLIIPGVGSAMDYKNSVAIQRIKKI